MILYDYFRSSTCYRVRIALNLKKIDYKIKPIHLLKNGGEQRQPEYQAINPHSRVPSLVDGKTVLTQSLAIIDYLDQKHPSPLLIPKEPTLRAQVNALAQIVACDIHPLNNLMVLQYLQHQLQVSDDDKNTWYKHWIESGFKSIEQILLDSAGKYCFGDQVTLADVCLIPQVYNAYRFECDMEKFPLIEAVNQHCLELVEFQNATPEAVAEEA